MRTHASFIAAVAFSVLALAGCSPDPVGAIPAHAQGKGTAQTYDVSFDDAWKAAHIALKWDQAGTPEDHLDERYVITNHPGSAGASFTDQVGVWFESQGPTRTKVKVVVVTGQESTAGIGGPDEQGVQKDIAKALSYVQSGQPVPEKKP